MRTTIHACDAFASIAHRHPARTPHQHLEDLERLVAETERAIDREQLGELRHAHLRAIALARRLDADDAPPALRRTAIRLIETLARVVPPAQRVLGERLVPRWSGSRSHLPATVH